MAQKDIDEIKDLYLKGLSFFYVDEVMEVINYALLKQKVKDPMKISRN